MSAPQLPCWVVIPATGIGSRMQADRPKQYLSLGAKTILEHTLDNLLAHPSIDGAVLVLSEQDRHWPALHYQHDKPLHVCHGGEQRYHSVMNGLQALSNAIDDDAIVMIHDAVRPFVLHTDLDRLLAAAALGDDGAILAVPVADTLKLADKQAQIQRTSSRKGLWRAYTPQAFRLTLIQQALQNVIDHGLQVTDDASAMELLGFHPRLVSSDSLNIKITHPGDLQLAGLLLQQRRIPN